MIRYATESDLPQILDIYNDAILNTTAVYSYAPHTLEMRKAWYAEKVEKNLPVLVMELEGRVAGFSSYGPFRAWEAYRFSAEHLVYVHQDFRQRGVAMLLLKELITTARVRGIHTLIAGIDADNAVSIRLHEKLGFQEAGHVRQVGFKFERWLDLKFYQKILGD